MMYKLLPVLAFMLGFAGMVCAAEEADRVLADSPRAENALAEASNAPVGGE